MTAATVKDPKDAASDVESVATSNATAARVPVVDDPTVARGATRTTHAADVTIAARAVTTDAATAVATHLTAVMVAEATVAVITSVAAEAQEIWAAVRLLTASSVAPAQDTIVAPTAQPADLQLIDVAMLHLIALLPDQAMDHVVLSACNREDQDTMRDRTVAALLAVEAHT